MAENSIMELIEDGKVIARGNKEFDDPAIVEKVAKMFPTGFWEDPDGRLGFDIPELKNQN